MKFNTAIAVAGLVAALGLVGTERLVMGQVQGGTTISHVETQLEQSVLVREYERLPDDVRIRIESQSFRDGLELPPVLNNLTTGRLLAQQPKITIFRGIQDELKPVVIRGNTLIDTFAARPLAAAAIPTGGEAARVLMLARSIGRIEIANAPRHIGTGFVVGDGLVATNCHVLKELVADTAAGTPRLKNDPASATPYLIDFSDTRAHDGSNEFVIEGIAGFPATQFLDVAVLRVRTKNLTGTDGLPPALKMKTAHVERDWSAGSLAVGVLGYPDYTNLRLADARTKLLFRPIWEKAADNVKLFSPGSVIGMDTFAGVEFMDHVASTLFGQSGSPVIERSSGDVIGVHYCCSEPGVPEVTEALACSSQRVSDMENNQAVSIWTARQDPVLRSFLAP